MSLHYDEYHNHKWARNLKHARRLLAENNLQAFYHGEDLPDNDAYPGMRVMAAYWVSVEHEMKLRRKTLLAGANHLDWETDPELLAAARWVLTQDAGEVFPAIVRDALKQMGYERITHQL